MTEEGIGHPASLSFAPSPLEGEGWGEGGTLQSHMIHPPPPQPAPDGLTSATPPQGGSDDLSATEISGVGLPVNHKPARFERLGFRQDRDNRCSLQSKLCGKFL